ncbi:hypothetical protein AX774_g6885 [Zancudomyces culisetae]|uniref:Uncharacterized protein n=1 Tax=Zancudomyces culisetae TaxID=1213189 RepID=A0A1R1PFQ6_ZANCU|nr:hypothetical protein AX774_g6885 [Zancudomyces culisetae]|eukprot:OMH79692.1 hypothetical protein AX774_g6885 [Zancudomyces culisetae]
MDYSKILPSSQTLQQNTNPKAGVGVGVGGSGVIFGKIQFVVLYLSACFVHVFVLLLTGLFAARATWRKKLESDYYVNPIM